MAKPGGGFPFFTATNLLIVVVVSRMAAAVEHTVGGVSGWTTGVDYGSWAAGTTFTVGDTLLFSYDGSHTVDVVDKSGYDNCDPTKATNSFQDGNTTISLTKPGPMFFICSVAGHCTFSGMKLSITVKDSTAGGRSPPPAAPSPRATNTTIAPPPTPTSTSGTPPRATPSPPTTPADASGPTRPPPPPSAAIGGFSRMSYVMLLLGSVLACLS